MSIRMARWMASSTMFLAEVDVHVEHVIAAGPAGGHLIGRSRRTVNADQMLVDPFQQFIAERKRALAGDSIASERDSAVPESHVLLSSDPRGAQRRRQTSPKPVRPGSLLDRATWLRLSSGARRRRGRDSAQSATSCQSGKVDELKRVFRPVSLQMRDHGLQVVNLLAGDPDLVFHDLGLHLDLELLDLLDHLAGVVGLDACMQREDFAHRVVRGIFDLAASAAPRPARFAAPSFPSRSG